MWFDLYFLSHSSWLQLGIHLDIQVKLWQIFWLFYHKYISLLVGLWELLFKIAILVSRLKLSRDSGFSSKIETIPPNSRCLDILQGFWGVPAGHASPDKIRNLRSSNCWKCIEIVNLTITVLFLYHFKYFSIPSGGPFCLLGGACAPRASPPPCLRAWLWWWRWCL